MPQQRWTPHYLLGQFLIGLGLPGLLCLVGAGIGLLVTEGSMDGARLGAYVGLFLSVLGGADIVGAILGGGFAWVKKVPAAAGFIVAWLLILLGLQAL